MLLEHADAVGNGGRGDAELGPGAGEALVAGGGLEEAQAFERWQGAARQRYLRDGLWPLAECCHVIAHLRVGGKPVCGGGTAERVAGLETGVSRSQVLLVHGTIRTPLLSAGSGPDDMPYARNCRGSPPVRPLGSGAAPTGGPIWRRPSISIALRWRFPSVMFPLASRTRRKTRPTSCRAAAARASR